MKQGNDLTWPQVVMAANAPMMTKAALVDGRTDVGVLPTGQVVGEIAELPTVAELIGRVMDEAGRRPRPARRRRSRLTGGHALARLRPRTGTVRRSGTGTGRTPGTMGTQR